MEATLAKPRRNCRTDPSRRLVAKYHGRQYRFATGTFVLCNR